MKALLSLLLLMGLLAPALAQPVITPANLTVNAGASFAFTANSNNAVTFQWVYDGTNIAGATNAEYYADNPSTNQAGVYWVVTSNMDSSISSNSATLTVLQGTVVNFTISHFSDGSSSNVVVELFDHDKPATVENFVHYIRSIGYSNMFFDRLIPGFVLQGGDYDANDRTNSTPGITASNIYSTIVKTSEVTNPPIPLQIDSEYYVGPHVSNVKGTLAMALPSGNVNGGNSAFFFNLVDNSGVPTELDSQQFTVFGRVIGGQNVLDYFNDTNNFSKLAESNFPPNLAFASNPFTNGIFDEVFSQTNATSFTDLPVNFYGTNVPANTNLFFVDFSFPDTQPIVDTTPPVVSITYPTPNLLVTNGYDLVVTGTASDNVGLALVNTSFVPLTNSNGGDLANGGSTLQAYATGTTNWSLDTAGQFGGLTPGLYSVQVTAQDGAGNESQTLMQNLIVTGVITNGVGTVLLTNLDDGSVATDAVGATMMPGNYYTLDALPGTNQIFVHWGDSSGDPNNITPLIEIEMFDSYVLTATFISNGIPGSIAMTFPSAQGTVGATNGVFAMQGTIGGAATAPVTISSQFYSTANNLAVGGTFQTTGTASWTLPVTNLADGSYLAQVIATDAAGRQTLITNSFTLETFDQLKVVANGPGVITTNLNGQFLQPGKTYSMRATASAGGLFENWSDNNGNVTLNPLESFAMSANLTLTANFIPNTIPGAIAFTYPIAGKTALATNGVLGIQGTIKAQASPPVAITCQLFTSAGALALGSPLQTSGTSAWSVQTNLANGQYYAQVVAQDALGRMTIITNAFSVQTVNKMTVVVNGPGSVTTDYDRQYLLPGTKYSMKAQAAKNGVFENWSDGVNTSINPTESFTMSSNLVLTATFLTNDIPGAIAFTYPAANAKLTNSAFALTGTAKSSITATQIVCQLFSNSTAVAAPVIASNSPGAWLVPEGNLIPGQTNLAPGNYTAIATAYNNTGESTLISESFSLLAHLTVATSSNLVLPPVNNASNVNTNVMIVPPQLLGTVSLANPNGGYLTAGTAYTISAKPKPGYLFAYWVLNGVTNRSSTYTFSLTSDQTITANFASNYFPRVAGTYDGIFYPPNTNGNSTNSGYFTMSITSLGTTTISLSFPDKTSPYKLAGSLPYYCAVDAELPGLDDNGLVLAFGMDLTNLSGTFTGFVYDLNDSWFGSLTAYRVATGLGANSAVVPGRYALAMPGLHGTNTTEPGGDSVATYSISSAGAVVVAGSLADGTPFTQSTGVSSNGIWPLYVPLYPGSKSIPGGVILGWQTNGLPTNYSGQVEWFKPVTAAKAGTYYNNGFAVQLSTAPAVYTEPVANTHYQIVFNGATLSGPQTNTLTVSPAHVFTADPGQKNLQVTLAVATGAITGQFMATNNTIKKITGAFSNPASGGSGYFLDTDGQTGYFEISLVP